MTDFFKGIAPVKFEGPNSTNPLAYRHYNKDEVVLGKRMEDHIRPGVAYWHTFAWGRRRSVRWPHLRSSLV